jgi:hypothetical protein
MLGRFVGRQDQGLPALVAALAGTRTPAVRELLQEVSRKLPSQEAGKAAERALEEVEPAHAAAQAGHSGELDGYSLPALLHRLAGERATGTLSLLPREGGGAPAAIGFRDGRLVSARFAHRQGASAVYQLFERPFPGEFAFDPSAVPDALASGNPELPELAALVREGVKRSQQLAATSALVPEDMPLEATGEAPATVDDEDDYELVVALWQKATSRVTPRQIEAELGADAFRIMRPLALWLEQGSLRLRVSAPPPPAPRT